MSRIDRESDGKYMMEIHDKIRNNKISEGECQIAKKLMWMIADREMEIADLNKQIKKMRKESSAKSK